MASAVDLPAHALQLPAGMAPRLNRTLLPVTALPFHFAFLPPASLVTWRTMKPTILYRLCGMTLLRPHNVMRFQPQLVAGTIQDDSELL